MTSGVASPSFTLDSGTSQCFFRDHTTVTPLSAPVLAVWADPSSKPAVPRSSTTLSCLAVPSGSLIGLYIPSSSRNLVGVGYLQDRGITVNFPAHGRTMICTDASTRALLATFTREPHSGLFFLHTTSSQVAESSQVTASPQVAESGQVTASPPVAMSSQVAASGQVAASCSCWSLTHPTVLWHHLLGHTSIPRLRSMASHRLVLGPPCVFASLPPSPAPLCTPCVVGRLRATPHSSSLRPATAPFQTLHLDVWGPAPTQGPKRERYFLVVVDDYSRYTIVFPLAKKSEVTSTLIWWLLATERTRGSCARCLHSDRGGEFCSGVIAGFCSKHGIRQSWTLQESPQQNGVAERRIGLVHARAPHFLWPYAGCLALVHDTSADKLLARAIPCVFLGFPVDSPDYAFYHLPLHQFLDSHDVRFDESVSYYTRYPCRGLPVPPPPLFLAPSPTPAPAPPVHPPPLVLPCQFPQQPLALPRQVIVDSGGVGAGGAATRGTRSGGVRSRGVGAGGAGTEGASSGGAGAGGAGVGGASSGGAGAGGAGIGGASSGGARVGGAGARLEQERQELQQLDQQQQQQQQQPPQPPLLQQLFPTVCGLRALGLPSSPLVHLQSPTVYGPTFPPPDSAPAVFSPPQSQLSPLVVPHGWTSRCPPCARPLSPFADLRTVLFRSSPRRSPPVSVLPSPPKSSLTVSSHPITDYYHAARPVVSHVLATLVTDPRASPLFVSALTVAVADFASTRRLEYATRVVAAPPPRPLSVGGESALGCDVLEDRQFELEFLAAASPFLCAMLISPEGDPEALDIPTPRTYREAVSREWASQWKVAMDSELASWRSIGTYVDAVPPPRETVVDGMWLFKVKRPPGSPPVFKACYVARGFIQLYGLRQSPREWHDTLCSVLRDLGFRPSSADPSLFVRAGSTPFFILVYVNDLVFARADRAALAEVKSELQKRHTCTYLGELQHYLGLQITRDSVTHGAAEAGIYAGAMAAQELRWLTFLLADLGERPRSAPTLYADNKAMILLCREPQLESSVKHIDVRYFRLRELQQRGQARLDFVASEANTVDVFTKALVPGDHHRFCVQLGLVEVGPRLL
ncbi:unnamed protein product [Closterium sp. NIES-53]